MPNMGDIKTVLLAAAGVIVAGIILYQGRDIGILNTAHKGFDYIG
ncbi:hypothetical protein [Asticcacaulis sp.]|nr:hypothetical protein [Asticcacaulis sp.]